MIRVRIHIEGVGVADSFDEYGMIYISSDNVFAPPTKGFETTQYAEKDGENVDQRTVDDAFDYTTTFLIETPNRDLTNANSKIAAINSLMYTKAEGSSIKTFRKLTIYNDYKRVRIVGIPSPIEEVSDDDFFRDNNGNLLDCVKVKLKLRVTEPQKCDFNVPTGDGTSTLANRLTYEDNDCIILEK